MSIMKNNSNNGRAAFGFIAEKVGAGVTNNVVNNVVSVANNVRKSVNKYAACNVQRNEYGEVIVNDRDTFSNREFAKAKSFGVGWCGSIDKSSVKAFHRCGSETAPYLHT